jgi:Tfp pilus assembly protein PilN
MSAIPVMLIVWAAIAACFLALLAYRGQLTRYEEDQLFLTETESNEQQEQTEIVRKVNKIRPFVNLFGYAAALMTIGIVGIFTYDAWQHLR